MAEWSADILLTDDDARALIRAQFPSLPATRCERIGVGWDNTVFLVDGAWVFRFPHREIALPGIAREMQVLPRLALPSEIAIPRPVWLGAPSETFPYPFFGYALVAGREAPEFSLNDDERAALAPAIARFLKALHAPSLVGEVGALLPFDPIGRSEMRSRVAKAMPRLDALVERGLWTDIAPLRRILVDAEHLAREPTERIIHGDLHFRHLMLDENRALAGVIDWGDLQRNEPCVDLQLYWSFLPRDARARFLAEYGPVSTETLMKARVLAVFLASVLAVYGHEEHMEKVRDEALVALRLCLQD